MQQQPIISIITVTLNCAGVVERTLNSVQEQSFENIEHIVVDGDSVDGTKEIIRGRQKSGLMVISEPDCGIYNAMNKGLRIASGNVVGFLSAGDVYADSHVLSTIANTFANESPDVIFGNLVYFDDRSPSRVVRTYDATGFKPTDLQRGIMPPHMATFVRRSLMLEVGGFDENYQIAGDFDCMIKLFLQRQAHFIHIPEVLVRMQRGGISNASLKNRWLVTKEFHQACRKHGVSTSWLKLFSRYPGKIWQSLRHGLG